MRFKHVSFSLTDFRKNADSCIKIIKNYIFFDKKRELTSSDMTLKNLTLCPRSFLEDYSIFLIEKYDRRQS